MLATVLVFRGVPQTYTYTIPPELESIQIGTHVTIPFGRSAVSGLIVDIQQKDVVSGTESTIKLKPITEIDEKKPVIPADLISCIFWMSDYHHVTLHKAYQAVIGVRKYRDIKLEMAKTIEKERKANVKKLKAANAALKANGEDLKLEQQLDTNTTINSQSSLEELSEATRIWPTLTPPQKNIIDDCLTVKTYTERLIHGITGSGKTEVYLNLAKHALDNKKSVIILVPEIALTPQLSKNFIERFGDKVHLLHSGLTPKQKDMTWNTMNEDETSLVLGPRSAIFSPVKNLGLIVIDEEHDGAYNQESSPRYRVIDVARYRAKKTNALLIKGSATPKLESYFKGVDSTHFEILERVHKTPLPTMHLVDIKKQEMQNRLFSLPLLDAIKTTLEKGQKIMILVNRRGFAPYIDCQKCGQVHCCPNCNLSYTYHKDKSFRCHRCFKKTPITHQCSACKKNTLKFSGTGIQKIEYDCRRLFPNANILRLDKDTGSTGKKIESILDEFRTKGDILIGTQMIAKGHHIENVNLVGILAIDNQLNIPDFRSTERTFQLMLQVAGRAGRDKEQGNVIIQTSQPDHYVFDMAKTHDFKSFYKKEVNYRKLLNYPPYSKLINILVSCVSQQTLTTYINDISPFVKKINEKFGAQVLGPSPAPVELINKHIRWHFLIKCPPDKFDEIHAYLRDLPRIQYVRTIVDFNPASIL
ncbi:primosomal protein N' [bacterium]|jgi:primosomal protein N' (replication factor Y) (superfamily II helicase)|nr:primosomal protein N' [bacterium]